jgi:gluconokinase
MVLILMGVAGSGKTTLGKRLAARLGCPFFDADDFHSPANRDKMASGQPLNDQDRADWIRDLSKAVLVWNEARPLTILACSALRQSYRDALGKGGAVLWIYLKATFALASRRLEGRQNHFFNPALLESQFKVLEEPEDAWMVDVSPNADTIMDKLVELLKDKNVLR